MLANLLAIVVGLGSFGFYMAAFIYPEVHRRADFLWSGLGFFYALVLWFGAGQIRGAVLLGQTASVGLLVGLGWQTLALRRATTPLPQRTPVVLRPELVTAWAGRQLDKAQDTIPAIETIRAAQVERKRVETSGPSSGWRRAYEYEFVEDGIDLTMPKELPKEPPKDVSGPIEPLAIEPPKESPEESPKEFSEAVLDESSTEPAPKEPLGVPLEAVAETPLAEPKPADSEADYPIPVPNALPEAEPLTVADVQPESVEPERRQPAAAQSTAAQPPAAKSALQGPIAKAMIIANWVKDVVVSLTRPKPARPMIELPPRPPSIPPAESSPSSEADEVWPADEPEDNPK